MFEDTISNLMMPITVVNDTAVQNKEVFLADKDSCLIGQKWILEESIPDNEIKFLENPCNVPGGCPLCAGDCDSDSDCAEGLRCLQRRLQRVSEGHIVIGRENVPGCQAMTQDLWVAVTKWMQTASMQPSAGEIVRFT